MYVVEIEAYTELIWLQHTVWNQMKPVWNDKVQAKDKALLG